MNFATWLKSLKCLGVCSLALVAEGTIRGTVLDPSGAVVSGAAVEVVDQD